MGLNRGHLRERLLFSQFSPGEYSQVVSLTEKFQIDIEANKNETEEIKEQMKVMENIVGRKMVSMDEKGKEEH